MSNVITFGMDQIVALKAHAIASPKKRVLINLHEHDTDRVHEMIICSHESTYVRPHRHPGYLESFHVIEGVLTVIVFDDVGNVTQTIPMGCNISLAGRHRLYRQRASAWHTTIVESEFAVIHEATDNPWPAVTEWAAWAPMADKPLEIQEYIKDLRTQLEIFGEK